ncbi:DNA polymerase IV [Sporolactobacillus inulinus]|uniref:Mutator family transposase n=1 Tax=Sporolactobacillus inulinus TaxID=2078 RepID=A0A4Y1ZIW7_9BACL|nr:DNA polymerase IV [Sporolactobacillus inulinus]
MAQVQITLNEQLLHQLFLGDAKSSGMNALLEAIFNQVLKAQASEQLKVEKYERSNVRTDYRNGSYPRQLKTRVGKLTLNVPRLRNGHFSTDLFNRYQRSEQALVLSLMEMVINGVSTRRVSQITEELCGTEFSKRPSQIFVVVWIRLSRAGTIVPWRGTILFSLLMRFIPKCAKMDVFAPEASWSVMESMIRVTERFLV